MKIRFSVDNMFDDGPFGIPDLERVEKLIMNELRDLKIGRMSYEKPEGRD